MFVCVRKDMCFRGKTNLNDKKNQTLLFFTGQVTSEGFPELFPVTWVLQKWLVSTVSLNECLKKCHLQRPLQIFPAEKVEHWYSKGMLQSEGIRKGT